MLRIWKTLGSFDIRYKPRSAIKGQVLANFVVKFSSTSGDACKVCQISIWPWKFYVDGALNTWDSDIVIVLESPEGVRIEHSLKLGF